MASGSGIRFNRRTALGLGALVAAGASGLTLQGCSSGAKEWNGTLNMLGWDFQPDMIKKLVNEWSGKANTKVDVAILPNSGYSAALQTRLRGGDVPDVYYNFAYNSTKMIDAGWARKLGDLPGASDMINDMFPSARASYLNAKGDQLSVPYYSAVHMLNWNKDIVGKAGFSTAPGGLQETYDQSKKIKETQGLESPYVAYWVKEFCEEYLMAYMLCEGVQPFNDQGDPTFPDDPKALDVLTWWQTMYTEGLAPKSLLNDDPGKLSSLMADGKAAFFVLHHYFLTSIRSLQGPAVSNIEQAPLSKDHHTLQMGEVLQMGNIKNERQRDAAWNLMKYYGWKGDDGKYSVFTAWAKAAGLAAPYPGFFEDPEVRAAFPSYFDLNQLKDTFENRSKVVGARTLAWYPIFQAKVGDVIHSLLLGQSSPKKALDDLAKAAADAKSKGTL